MGRKSASSSPALEGGQQLSVSIYSTSNSILCSYLQIYVILLSEVDLVMNSSSLRLKILQVALLMLATTPAFSQVQVTTYHNDNSRTGLNASETILTPANVRPWSFGLLFSLPVDGQVYAQPLYLSGVTIPGKGVHNVLYVATEHNSLYAFDADSNLGANAQPLWHLNFGPSVPSADTHIDDITPEIGITSTPVIYQGPSGDPVIFVVSKTKVMVNGAPIYIQRLVAVDALTGYIKTGGVVSIAGKVPGTGEGSVNGVLTFNPLLQHCRPGLLLVPPPAGSTAHAQIYACFASHGDYGAFHGWVFVYDAQTMALLNVLCTTPNAKNDPSGFPLAAGGIWQSGQGPASDGSSVFLSTGNGWFEPATQAYGDSILRLDTKTFKVLDYFAPRNQLVLDDYDSDLGSGGVMLLPDSASGTSKKKLLVQAGKEGTIYLVDTANLGKNNVPDQIVQELKSVMGGVYGSPAYFRNTLYYGPSYSPMVSFPIQNGLFPKTTPSGYTTTTYQFPGPTPSISSNGLNNGIVWAVQTDGFGSGASAILHAYDALNIGNEIYNSGSTFGRDAIGGAVKFAVPTVANGKVYVGSDGQVGVFGNGTWPVLPMVLPASGNYSNRVGVQVTDATPGTTIHYTEDGTTPTLSSPLYTGPVTVTNSLIFKARAFSGSTGSGVIERDLLINGVIGTGTGLSGAYYAGVLTPTGTPTATEIDPIINFDWSGKSPATGVGTTNWAAEWTGHLQAESTGLYTLTTNSDDGVRVYVNGTLVINNFIGHSATLNSGTISLVAGQKYTIDIKYFQQTGDALLQFFWAGPGIPYQLVPTKQLYPN